MKLGLDFYKTITVCPRIYKKLAETILAGGGQVHIITAVKPKNVEKVKTELAATSIPYTELHIIEFENYDDIPELKAQICGSLDLDMLIDDMLPTVELVYKSHIVGIQSLGGEVK